MTKTLATVVNDVWYSPTGKYGSLNFNTWHHICVAIDLEREVISYVGEGVVLDELEDFSCVEAWYSLSPPAKQT